MNYAYTFMHLRRAVYTSIEPCNNKKPAVSRTLRLHTTTLSCIIAVIYNVVNVNNNITRVRTSVCVL